MSQDSSYVIGRCAVTVATDTESRCSTLEFNGSYQGLSSGRYRPEHLACRWSVGLLLHRQYSTCAPDSEGDLKLASSDAQEIRRRITEFRRNAIEARTVRLLARGDGGLPLLTPLLQDSKNAYKGQNKLKDANYIPFGSCFDVHFRTPERRKVRARPSIR